METQKAEQQEEGLRLLAFALKAYLRGRKVKDISINYADFEREIIKKNDKVGQYENLKPKSLVNRFSFFAKKEDYSTFNFKDTSKWAEAVAIYIFAIDNIEVKKESIQTLFNKKYPVVDSITLSEWNIFINKSKKYKQEEIHDGWETNIKDTRYITPPVFLGYSTSKVSRTKDIEHIETNLKKYTKPLCIKGIGGLGKTYLAKSLVDSINKKYHTVAWIDTTGDPMPAFLENYPIINYLYKHSDYTDYEEANTYASKVRQFKKILWDLSIATPPFGLMLIDGVDQDILKYIPDIFLKPNWHLIVTSRNDLEGFDIYEPLALTQTEGEHIFLSYYIKDTKYKIEDIQYLVDSVWIHPLAIEILAKTANTHPLLNVSKIRKLFKKKGLYGASSIDISTDYKKLQETTIAECLDIAFSIADFEKDEYTVSVLKELSLLPSIPLTSEDLYKLLNKDENDQDFANSLIKLDRYGWFSIDNTIAGKRFYLHPVIQDTIRRKFKVSFHDIRPLIDNIADLFVPEKYRYLNLNLFTIFISNILDNVIDANGDGTFIILYGKLGEFFLTMNRLAEAKSFYSKLEQEIKNLKPTNETEIRYISEAYNNMARVYRFSQSYKDLMKAHNFVCKAIRTVVPNLKKNSRHAHLSNLYNTLGNVNRNLQREKSAIFYYKQALQIIKKSDDRRISERLLPAILSNLGTLYTDTKDKKIIAPLKQGQDYYKKAIDIYTELFYKHKDSVNNYVYRNDLAATYTTYADLLAKRKDYKEALNIAVKATRLYKDSCIELNQDPMFSGNLSSAYHALAGALSDNKRAYCAIKFQLKSIDIKKNIYANEPNNNLFAQAYRNLASFYFELYEQTKIKEHLYPAGENFEKSKQIYEYNNQAADAKLMQQYADHCYNIMKK